MKTHPGLFPAAVLCALCGCGGTPPVEVVCERPPAAATAPAPIPVTLKLDYAGAEAVLRALERDSLSDADVDALLRVHGARAMVDNVTRFIPGVGVPEFRSEIKSFVRRKRTGDHSEFQLADVWRERSAVRELIGAIEAEDSRIVREALAVLEPYALDTGPLAMTAYFTAGGVSNGFVFDDGAEPAFYANLARADGRLAAVVGNLAHESYHVMQKAAQRRAGLHAVADSSEALPVGERLLAVTLAEGLANYVVDPTCATTTQPEEDSESLERYAENAQPDRIVENFAVFDEVLADFRADRSSWEEAYERGFSGNEGARFYFVGYQMAKAIERHCGRACIPRLFEQPPVEFFRQYVALYREHPEIPGRFAPETESFLASLR